jgi:hypothetical protein
MTSLVSQARIVCLFCKYCGMSRRLSRVEPSLMPEHDRITYECPKSDHSLIKEVSFRYLRANRGASKKLHLVQHSRFDGMATTKETTPLVGKTACHGPTRERQQYWNGGDRL